MLTTIEALHTGIYAVMVAAILLRRCQWHAERPVGAVDRAHPLGGSGVLWERTEVVYRRVPEAMKANRHPW
jgi:hypothetical protein